MADPRFFDNAGPFSLGRLAKAAGAELSAGSDPDRMMSDVAPLDTAGASDVSFLDNPKYLNQFKTTAAGACIVAPKHAEAAPAGMALLLSPMPYHVYARIAQLFYPASKGTGKVAPSAIVAASASVDASADLEPGCVIGEGADIGAGCRIGANAVIGRGVIIGPDSSIGANVSILNAVVGARAIIHPGVRIGQDGFGFAMGPGGHEKVPQLGRVVIGDDVEIGGNSTIDRGTGPDTVIGSGTKIDNLVQIGHNAKIGANCVIVSQVGISGSTELGDFVVLAGQVGIAGHLKIGPGTKIAAQSGVMHDIPAGVEFGGSPARPMRQWLRQIAMLERLGKKKGSE